MTSAVRLGAGFRGIVLDVEGTTTPVSFVYDVLFPYARAHLREYLREVTGHDDFRGASDALRAEWVEDVARGESAPPWNAASSATVDQMAAYLEWLMDRDRKSTALKLVQGRIWERGYADGTLRGEVYPDVAPALDRWHAAGQSIAIYSSGSVLAQRLLFGHSTAGDLTRFIDHYFDTAAGPKQSPASYARIAAAMGRRGDELLFVSDVAAELEAARLAGCAAVLCDRSSAATADVVGNFENI